MEKSTGKEEKVMEKPAKNYSNILIGTPLKNSKPYLETYAHQLVRLDYPKENITIAIVENDSDDYSYRFLREKTVPFLKKFPYKAVYLEKKDLGFQLSHSSRHRKEIFGKRAECVDIIRQYIIDTYLVGNEYVLWFDSDFEIVDPQSLVNAISHDADVVIHNLRLKNGTIYDSSTLSGGKFIENLMKEDKQKQTWTIDSSNCHYLIHRRVFDRGYVYWPYGAPILDGKCRRYSLSSAPENIYTFTGKNIDAIFDKHIVTIHMSINGMKPIPKRRECQP